MRPKTTNVSLQDGGQEANRKRKAHKKSRLGCRNCKLRSVKCDETRPRCEKCTAFGVICNYNREDSDLQTSVVRSASIKSPQKRPYSVNQSSFGIIDLPACPGPVTISDDISSFQLDRESLNRFSKFLMRTIFSLGNERTARRSQSELIKLSYSNPYLMHFVQVLTAVHDRYLFAPPDAPKTGPEVYHWSRAVALFNRKLSTPLQPLDREPLWACAALLAIIAFCSIEASTPEESWPLSGRIPSSPEWLALCQGKKTIWKVANSLKPDGVSDSLADEYVYDYPPSKPIESGTERIPSALYGIDDSSTPENNPYHTVVHTLAPLLNVDCTQPNTPMFFSFIEHIQPRFRRLLEHRDPRALVLMAFWYAKICRSRWWVTRRAMLECQATCLYLERYHSGETAVQELLQYPKMACGLG